jgi:hypothetical protein
MSTAPRPRPVPTGGFLQRHRVLGTATAVSLLLLVGLLVGEALGLALVGLVRLAVGG